MTSTRALLVAALLLTACTPTAPVREDDVPLTYGYAVERVERLISDAAAALTDRPVLRPAGDTDAPCLDPGEAGSRFNGQVQPGRAYVVTGLPPDRTPDESIELLARHWRDQGYRLEYDSRPQVLAHGYTADPGFGIAVEVNARGDLALIASGPCVDPA